MIHPKAIRQFVSRPRDQHSWMKKLTADVVDPELERLGFTLSLNDPPFFIHQKICALLGIAYPKFAFWLDMGCVDCDTEYLSPEGWKRIVDYKSGKVMQYDPATKKGTFVEPSRFVKRNCSEMFRFHTRFGVDQKLSSEHKVLYADYKGRPKTCSALDLVNEDKRLKSGWTGRFYSTFDPDLKTSIPMTDDQIRVQVAVMADGSFWGKPTTKPMAYRPNAQKMCSVRLQKSRKKIRLRELLKAAGIPYKERQEPAAPADMVNFCFAAPRRDKEFTEFYWGASKQQLAIISEEIFYWDGTLTQSTPQFYTTSKSTADFAQYALVASGRTTSMQISDRPNTKRLYTLTSRKHSALLEMRNRSPQQSITVEKTSDGKKYCFEVPSGFLVYRRNGCVFVSGNTGKTRLTLELLRYWMQRDKAKVALILVYSESAVYEWENQIAQWRIDLPYVSLYNSPSAKKWEQVDELEQGLIIATYAGFTRMLTKMHKEKRAKRAKLVPDDKLVKKMGAKVQAIVWDEATKIATKRVRGQLAYRLSNRLAKTATIRYQLAGIPFGRDPTTLWSQLYLIDRGETLGDTLGMFRAAFFEEKYNYFGGTEYIFKKSMEAELHRVIQHRSISYGEEECNEIPKLVAKIEEVTLPGEAQAYYDRFVKQIKARYAGYEERKNAFVRMRQVSSGFVGFMDDETGERAEISFATNPKLDRLADLVEQVPHRRKFVIFHEFTNSGRMICNRLSDLGIKHEWLWGGNKNVKRSKDRFDNDDGVRGIVVNHFLGGYSLNLQRANYLFYFESPVPVITRKQSEKRVRRTGQERRVFQYDLVCRGTVDSRILAFHREGADLFKAIVRNPEKALS